jgi:hypothetical protein
MEQATGTVTEAVVVAESSAEALLLARIRPENKVAPTRVSVAIIDASFFIVNVCPLVNYNHYNMD